jgi:glutamyl-Q tRNA(Asp) synthetase
MHQPSGKTQPVFRFAPSPNGYLHLGHALSALKNFDMARATGGRFLLRIEDIDTTRCRPHYEQAIYEDLAWLGIEWEAPVRRQSDHLAEYREALNTMEAAGLLYRNSETRAAFAARVVTYETQGRHWPRDPEGAALYPGPANAPAPNHTEGRPFALRLRMQEATRRVGPLAWREYGSGPRGEIGEVMAQPLAWGDIVLARKEMPTSYHLAVTLDDARQRVTHVVRGQDLFWSTSVHRLLQTLLGLPVPVYTHHRLVLDVAGVKLAKSTKSTALRELRAAGVTPDDVREMLFNPASGSRTR